MDVRNQPTNSSTIGGLELPNAVDRLKSQFPHAKTGEFLATLDAQGRIIVSLTRTGAVDRLLLTTDGKLNTELPKSLRALLGPSASEIIEKNANQIKQYKEDIIRAKAKLDDPLASTADKEAAQELLDRLAPIIKALDDETEAILGRMTLREKVKYIFNKYGFTVVGVAVAAGAVIAAVVSALSARLAAVAGAMGNGLKAIGKKLAELLPGAIGAIASFIFRTTGDVVGFLAKNAWLLIVAVVVFLVERVSSGPRPQHKVRKSAGD
ncbi:hypothetical protein QZH41_003501 [Actinostola sp. cb2023]|nr:hypothetical protein QZH41_003501 [Actinostola sp. cb2023]